MNDKRIVVAITEASYSGNKGAAAMLQSSITQLRDKYGENLCIKLISVWPEDDKRQIPWDFVDVVSAKAWQTVFIAFPISILYRLFYQIKPIKGLLLKNNILRAYNETDVVLDEAGVSFVDSRGTLMNTFAFICMAIPLLMGKTIVKYSQAMGSFNNPVNRLQARIILKRIRLIIARGDITKKHLSEIGIEDNVCMHSDGAFSMNEDSVISREVENAISEDPFFFSNNIVGVSPSTVVNKKCKKGGIDYINVLSGFINSLIRDGYNVFVFANAARENTNKPRNNDLLICDEIFQNCADKEHVRYYHKEMAPEEILCFVGKCRFVIASRFHAMIFSLKQKVPVMLIGWSHKYQEVLDWFDLGKYATDYSGLSSEGLLQEFRNLVSDEEDVRKKIEQNYEYVINSSYKNIEDASKILDEIINDQSNR